ncbi:DUF502 domain-containing protein [Niveibacterium sp. SC-1]|uniref:DUF502 domain-containing protein n=1 Tax=Niveibacterium sp. SC-1 TaxID=3135646 RepID=UPI00311D4932
MHLVRKRIGKTFLAGLLALLPLALTLALLGWVLSLLVRFVGPTSLVGRLLKSIGFNFVDSPLSAYAVGIAILVAGVYGLGIVVQSRLRPLVMLAIASTVRKLPVIGRIYDLSDRFVGAMGPNQDDAMKAMTPVWCFFGGEGSVATLALMPNPEPITLGTRQYRVVMVPTAPVPIGGLLFYVPAEWVVPAGFGVDKLTAIYVSMGISAPPTNDLNQSGTA